jgi:hypothetical protein
VERLIKEIIMSQFKRFNASENDNYNSSDAYPEGTLTWDPSNGLRIHDGNTSGGNTIGAGFSGDYNDLSSKPFIPATLTDLISSGGSNAGQFLRYDNGTGQIEFSSDFRVVPFADVAYPNGTLGQDKAGDVAFSAGAIYYCVNTPNSYSLTWVPPTGWASGIIELSNRGPNNEVLALGSTLTDGNQVVTVTELITGGWDGTRQVVRLSTEISEWRSGTGTLTVLTSGTTANTTIWVKFVNSYNDLSDKPTILAEPSFTLHYQNFNAVAGSRYCIDAVGQAVTATLPASPTTGDAIFFVDAYGSFATNNLTIVGNGKTIMGSPTLVLSVDNSKVGVFYSGSEWRTY